MLNLFFVFVFCLFVCNTVKIEIKRIKESEILPGACALRSTWPVSSSLCTLGASSHLSPSWRLVSCSSVSARLPGPPWGFLPVTWQSEPLPRQQPPTDLFPSPQTADGRGGSVRTGWASCNIEESWPSIGCCDLDVFQNCLANADG